jgi:hypothetical protein
MDSDRFYLGPGASRQRKALSQAPESVTVPIVMSLTDMIGGLALALATYTTASNLPWLAHLPGLHQAALALAAATLD